jgi:hypothetical protein
MVRIYDAIIGRLSSRDEDIPAGWTGLIDDEGDEDPEYHPGESGAPNESWPATRLDAQEVYYGCWPQLRKGGPPRRDREDRLVADLTSPPIATARSQG